MGHQSYVLLYAETTLSNHPVLIPKSSFDVHLLRSPWFISRPNYANQNAVLEFVTKLKKSGISVLLIRWFNNNLSKFDESNYF